MEKVQRTKILRQTIKLGLMHLRRGHQREQTEVIIISAMKK